MMATYFVVIMATLLLMSIYILGVLKERLYENEQVTMFAKANIIADTIAPNVSSGTTTAAEQDIIKILSGTNMRAIAVNKAYYVMFDSNSELMGKIFIRDIVNTAFGGEQAVTMAENEQGTNMISVAVPIKSGSDAIGVIYLIESVDSIDKTISYVTVNLLMISVLISVLVGMLSLGMSYIVTSPIDEFIIVAKEISKGNFDKKVAVKGHNEFAQMAETLNFMTDELESLEEKRKNFVSDVSHELKTPLATIKLICDSIVATPDPDAEMLREFLGDLSEEVDRLTRIVESLLALTRMDSGKAQLKPVAVDAAAMIHAIVRNLTPKASEKGIVLYTNFTDEINYEIMLDYDKIWEAIYNIVDNAIKYSPQDGFVRVSLQKEGDFAVVRVEDNGPGIPEAEKERIFERFYRLDDSRARDTGGTGLGLAIAKEVVTMHGGTITVLSEGEMGSIFSVSLPIIVQEAVPAETAAGMEEGGTV